MRQLTRRQFVHHVAAAGAMTAALPSPRAKAAADKVQLACIGVGGKGLSDLRETSRGNQVVAICDVDESVLAAAAKEFPGARRYTDWRKMLEQPDIDAVTVSTPDHTHAPATMTALKLGKHVFTQKPLTHSVFESRRLTEAARRAGVVTQMGIQHHASARLKTAVQVVRDGVIGKVREVHTWTDRPGRFWKQGLERPAKHDPVPATLHWDQWLGTAPARPYVANLYHRFHWRGWWDFGTGALGDMGCHILDPVVNALELGPPHTVSAEGPPPHPESGPLWCIVRYQFPGTRHTTESLQLTWYEAGRQPPRETILAPDDWKGSQNGVLFVGEKGNLFVGFPETAELFPKADFASYQLPQLEDHNHYLEWTDAILGKGKTSCPFEYAGPLTETVLLGNVAYRSGREIHWDSEHLAVADGGAELAGLLRRTYREGWQVGGL